ncbi:uncharacterized protein LOC123711094 isoform X2 [Pieris brassicae]|uniref:BCAS3 WD40 domain-containing protein n=1 Tax=Pieris brassicae TaxID=7116 RepID=A0A9P0TVW8_PIEBR|nr:uncharacterized protein LOC123711094 isoform X2 [Pieris brassicae]CAH4036543.1 unnamed protein product [Pieris brassicae]
MSAESPRHARSGGPLIVPSQPPSDRSIIDAVSGFINDVTLSSSSAVDPKDVIQWARFETADINEPTPEGEGDNDVPPLLLILGYGSGVQVWLIPPNGEAQEVLSWRQGTVRVLRILPTPQNGDCFSSKRPLIALCDSASPGPVFCSLSFISIRGGEQVKSIKFKNPILDVLANKRSVVVSFSERFAVFDAATLEDRLAITTCYPSPCPLGGNSPINPLALGDRWLAFADKKLNPSKRSSGGCESEGVTSYTATVLHAAKSLSKGLRGLGESVAHSLAGGRSTSQSPSPPHTDLQQPGIITILDIEGNEDDDSQDCEDPCDPIVAHFIAHSEAIIALKFDPSGMLLVTADKRGHDFHVFRINPHPCGPTLASVHHLYVLHRGDTTAKVQDIAISGDSRWTAISTLRGTTHVFALSPYGGACAVRTHTQPRVVNRMSRFHRSAGLPIHASHAVMEGSALGSWYPNPRLPPYPHPTTSPPLAQLRPTHNLPTHTITRNSSGRQRLSSLSEESGAPPLLGRAWFGTTVPSASGRGCAVPLYLMAANGSLLHLLLHPRPARSVSKEKICDESPIELEVEPVAQWMLQRPAAAADLLAPLPPSNPLLQPLSCRRCADMCMSEEERWLSQVEIVTHAGPHRRLWMGPQFVFKTYNCGSNSSLSEAEAVEVDTSACVGAARSNPVNMPGVRPIVPVLIESGSASSLEHSPSDSFRRKSLLADGGRTAVCDVQLKEDLAEAMKEDHGLARVESGREREVRRSPGVVRAVDPLGTVVAPPAATTPEPLDPDDYTRANDDEATFRPVVRAPAAPLPSMLVKPLPITTTIPVETVSPQGDSPNEEPIPLKTDVVIPAQLTSVPPWQPRERDVSSSSVPVESTGDTNTRRDNKFHDIKLDDKPTQKDLDSVNVRKDDSTCERNSTRLELESEDVNTSLPKLNRLSDDIQPTSRPRVKKSPTSKLFSDRVTSDSGKDKRLPDSKLLPSVESGTLEPIYKEKLSQGALNIKTNIATEKSLNKEKTPEPVKAIRSYSKSKSEVKETKSKGTTEKSYDELKPSAASMPDKENSSKKKSSIKENEMKISKDVDTEIKSEDQAWDMLVNESNKTKLESSDNSTVEKLDDFKVKNKKGRRPKKMPDEQQSSKDDDDSFVEIHAIEDKQQPSSGELVSISTTFEDFESSKTRKRASKSFTPERKSTNTDEVMKLSDNVTVRSKAKPYKSDNTESLLDFETHFKTASNFIKQSSKDTTYFNSIIEPDSTTLTVKEISKYPKSKSPSPNRDRRKSVEKQEVEKEVYVIDTVTDDFPEIQITQVNKMRKKSPQLIEKNNQDVGKPCKSWSSIAAKKVDDKKYKPNVNINDDNTKSSISLQQKLAELCKRTDIVVAECDAPTELNFVDEHHAVLPDFPPLESLDFGLDDFKLDVMKDSLLDVTDKITSPICKINIDDILSSIKDTKKSEESTSFNLIDVEKVPARKEKGFSVLETEKITSQEVQADDEVKDKFNDLEKSSDEDAASPVLSADSDKEEKNVASSVTLPSPKQTKSKKSRRKKK